MHDHALVANVEGSNVEWVCPDGAWRCSLGAYEESTWPPPLTAGYLAAALCARLERHAVTGWRRLACVERDGQWIAQVGIWPMNQTIIDAVTQAAAPIPVEFEPCQEVFIRVGGAPAADAKATRR